MADIKQPPLVIIERPATPATSDMQRQMFGPWTANDPKIQRTIVRTNASSGIMQKRFAATYPPAPTVNETRTAITGGFEFAINTVTARNISGYNVYSSLTNNPNVAKLIKFVAQPPKTTTLQALKIQDITAASPFYWVASVNSAGKESARVPISGNPPPLPSPTSPTPSGGGSGGGYGGGGGRSGRPSIL